MSLESPQISNTMSCRLRGDDTIDVAQASLLLMFSGLGGYGDPRTIPLGKDKYVPVKVGGHTPWRTRSCGPWTV